MADMGISNVHPFRTCPTLQLAHKKEKGLKHWYCSLRDRHPKISIWHPEAFTKAENPEPSPGLGVTGPRRAIRQGSGSKGCRPLGSLQTKHSSRHGSFVTMTSILMFLFPSVTAMLLRGVRCGALAGKQRRSIIQVPDKAPKTPAGFLQDKDRIFQNIYNDHGQGLKNAQKLVCFV